MSHFTSLLLSLLRMSDAVLRDHKRSHIQERSTRQISTLVGSGIVLVYRQVTTFLLWSHPRPFPGLFSLVSKLFQLQLKAIPRLLYNSIHTIPRPTSRAISTLPPHHSSSSPVCDVNLSRHVPTVCFHLCAHAIKLAYAKCIIICTQNRPSRYGNTINV